jgi:hypothetical protein
MRAAVGVTSSSPSAIKGMSVVDVSRWYLSARHVREWPTYRSIDRLATCAHGHRSTHAGEPLDPSGGDIRRAAVMRAAAHHAFAVDADCAGFAVIAALALA